MISKEDLNPKRYILTQFQSSNLDRLYNAISQLESAYGEDFVITSGVRSQIDQDRINPGAKNSAHISGEAVDVSDRDGMLWGWMMDNIPLLERLGLYLEDKSYTKSWVHFQIRMPRSKNRVFIP